MSHSTQLELSMLVDKALPEPARARVQNHVSGCARCSEEVTRLRQELLCIKQALAFAPVAVPAFIKPLRASDIFRAAVILAGIAWIMVFVWQSLLSDLVMQVIGWFNPFHISESVGLTVRAVFFVTEEGSVVLNTLYTFAVIALLMFAAFWVFSASPRARKLLGLGLCVMVVGAGMGISEPAEAIEIRKMERGNGSVETIAENEIIEDTLVVVADTIVIDGRVEGDLIAMGRRVIVNGTVTGNLIVFSQSVDVAGEVLGSMLNFSQETLLNGGTIGSNLWTYAFSLQMNEGSSVGQNATAFTKSNILAGSVGKDLTTFTNTMEVSGSVGDDIVAWANRLSLMGGSNVAGNVSFHTHQEDHFQRLDNAVVGGVVDVQVREGERRQSNKYATARYYINQLLRIAGGFIAGLCLLALFPALRQTQLGGGMDTLKSAGLGFLALISMPLAAGILFITIIGIPLSIVTMFAWIALWFFAKIMLAWVVGSRLLASREGSSWALSLLAGITLVIVIINLPKVGGILNFCMTLVGAGLLVSPLLRHVQKA